MNLRIVVLTLLLAICQLSHADPQLVAQASWSRADLKLSNLICQLRNQQDADDNLERSLRCWESSGALGKAQRGRLVFERIDNLYPDSLYQVSQSLLLSTWQSGTANCYLVLDGSQKTPAVVVEECSKGRLEINFGPKNEVALLLQQFDCCNWKTPTHSKIFCWSGGKLRKQEVAWNKRLDWLQRECWQ